MNIKEKRTMTHFIQATQEIMDEYGVEEITIRKIAEKSGYNSATIYNYFRNLEVLIIYASIGYLKDYILELRRKTKDIKNPKYKYIEVYRVFNEHIFKRPDVYFNMFYGSYSSMLPEIIKDYYEIFKEELEESEDKDINDMLTNGDIFQRDYMVTRSFLKEGLLSEKKIKFLVETTVRVHSSFLYDVIYKKDTDKKEYGEKFLSYMEELIDLLIGGTDE